MKKAYVKNLIRLIVNTKARFLSIFCIVFLGASMFAGLRHAPIIMHASMNNFLETYQFNDLEYIGTIGYSKEDINTLKDIDTILDIDYGIRFDVLIKKDKITDGANVYTRDDFTHKVNMPMMMEGNYPTKDNECLLDSVYAQKKGYSLHDTIILENDQGKKEFVIVGIINDTRYISNMDRGSNTLGDGSNNAFIMILTKGNESFALPQELYDLREESILYNDIRITLKDNGDLFSETYQTILNNAKKEIDKVLDDRYVTVNHQIVGDARETLEDAIAQYLDGLEKYNDGKDKYEDGLKQYQDGYAKYLDAVKLYEDGKAEYEDGYAKYLNAVKKYEEGKKQYQDGYVKYLDGEKQYEQGLKQYEDGLTAYTSGNDAFLQAKQQYVQGLASYQEGFKQYEESLAQYEAQCDALRNQGIDPSLVPQMQEAKQQLDATKIYLDQVKQELDQNALVIEETQKQLAISKQQLDESKIILDQTRKTLDQSAKTLSASKRELDNGKVVLDETKTLLENSKQELDDGKKELDESKITLDDSKLELENAKKELDDAKQELDDALTEIKDGQEAIKDIPEGEIVKLTWEENSGIVGYDANCAAIEGLSLLFPLIFFLVAALVSLTTMTRMVEEQRGQSGVYRALGYDKKAVIMQYIIYAFLATFFASLLGLIFGTYFYPIIIVYLYRLMMYNIGFDIIIIFDVMICLQAFFISVGVTLLVTWFVCYQELNAMPATLIRPKAPKLGKRILLERITPLWKRFSFNQKVTMRNIFRYKKRFFMSIIGIAGCSALLVTAFGIKGSIATLADEQYHDIWHYDGLVSYDINDTDEEVAKLEKELANQPMIKEICNYYDRNVFVNDDYYAVLEVPSDVDKFESYVTLNDYDHNNETLHLEDDGVYINAKLAELLGVSKGDSISININDEDHEVVVNGIYQLYFRHYIYMSKDFYQSLTDEIPTYSGAYYHMNEINDSEEEKLSNYITSTKGIASTEFVDVFADNFRDQMESINSVVAILMVCAGALAFIVLYNLTNINIQERKSEIATIKVLGFYPKEVYDYVFRENIWLSFIGSLTGLLLGKLLHGFLIRLVEVDQAMFIRSVSITIYIISLIITYIFTKLINLIMRKVLNKIDMVESLKSVE